MLTSTTLFGSILSVAMLTACQPKTPVNPVKEPRTVSAFSEVDLQGAANVIFTVGSNRTITVEGDKADVQNTITKLEGKKFVISQKQNAKIRREVTIRITAPSPQSAIVSGAGQITLIGIKNTDLILQLDGAGGIVASGTSKNLKLVVAGAGSIDAQNLKAEAVSATVDGVGSIAAFASKSMDANVNGVGNIIVHGKPATLKKNVNGPGSVSSK